MFTVTGNLFIHLTVSVQSASHLKSQSRSSSFQLVCLLLFSIVIILQIIIEIKKRVGLSLVTCALLLLFYGAV